MSALQGFKSPPRRRFVHLPIRLPSQQVQDLRRNPVSTPSETCPLALRLSRALGSLFQGTRKPRVLRLRRLLYGWVLPKVAAELGVPTP